MILLYRNSTSSELIRPLWLMILAYGPLGLIGIVNSISRAGILNQLPITKGITGIPSPAVRRRNYRLRVSIRIHYIVHASLKACLDDTTSKFDPNRMFPCLGLGLQTQCDQNEDS